VVVLAGNPSGIGIYRSASGQWIEDVNFNRALDAPDINAITTFAGNGLTPQAGDIPVVGDWSGNGIAKIGIFRPSTGAWYLDYNGNGVYDGPSIDKQYFYGGLAGDIPVVGDWNGTGFAKVGIFRAGFFFILNTGGTGVFTSSDLQIAFGGLTGCTTLPGIYSIEPAGSCDIPVVGDWNSSGVTKVGIVRAAPGTGQPFLWILDTTGNQAITLSGSSQSSVFAFGGVSGDVPVVGDWGGSSGTSPTGFLNIGVFRAGFLFVEDVTFKTISGSPAAGDTLVSPAYGGVAGDIPVIGRWR